MLREIYAIPEEEMRFKENTLELSNELDEIIQQVDLLLFTRKGDVLCMPEFGCDLEMYLFETEYNEVAIKQIIWQQINTFIYLDGTYTVDINVESNNSSDFFIYMMELSFHKYFIQFFNYGIFF